MGDNAVRRPKPQARGTSAVLRLEAPTRGLSLGTPLAAANPAGAEVLENFLPTARGIRPRGGARRIARLPDGETAACMIGYDHPTQAALFCATATKVFDVTDMDPTATARVAVIAGQTAGYYGSAIIGTTGGRYLVLVNGADTAWLFNGTVWNPLAGVTVSNLAYDGQTAPFARGQTVTGGTSGASATILAVIPATETTGVLKVGTITGGPFQDNEAITSSGGAAVANGASASASAITVAGVDTADLSQVWLYRNRLFFVEKDSLTAWYLPVASIGGTALSVSLAGVFKRGGSILFGASWSADSGSGLGDRCVFVSDQGEVAIYEGSDPSDADSWGIVGRYDIASPLGIRAHVNIAGDLLIGTVAGVVPISQVVQKDPAAMELATASFNVRTIWDEAQRSATGPAELVKWPDGNMILCLFPGYGRALSLSLLTGGWAAHSGKWPGVSATVWQGSLFHASGYLYELDVTGADDGAMILCRYCHSFQDMKAPGALKQVTLARYHFLAQQLFPFSAGVAVNYTAAFGASPAGAGEQNDTISPGAASPDADDYLTYNEGEWNEKLWWGKNPITATISPVSEWVAVQGAGFAVAPTLQISSDGPERLNIELIAVELVYQIGGYVV